MKMAEITSDKSWSCLRNEFNKKKTENLVLAAQRQDLKPNLQSIDKKT